MAVSILAVSEPRTPGLSRDSRFSFPAGAVPLPEDLMELLHPPQGKISNPPSGRTTYLLQ